ncbi:hypothetical protein HAX54_002371 [Datura stramonium]|uniref:Uncharacterized protein n=1 Tax=Datura stramonium TaxID=4076 RepID=A0ABS8YA34_DATST|nr:hypothetical protein [Datura stramonium]
MVLRWWPEGDATAVAGDGEKGRGSRRRRDLEGISATGSGVVRVRGEGREGGLAAEGETTRGKGERVVRRQKGGAPAEGKERKIEERVVAVEFLVVRWCCREGE